MPYNCYGDLHKSEVVKSLNEKGFNVKNVHELNLILEEMGLQRHSGNSWPTTQEGVKYTIYRYPGIDADAWHPTIVEAIIKYLTR